MFKIGQKVVCIKGFSNEGRYQEEIDPLKGDVLTIRYIDHRNGYLQFEELRNPILEYRSGFCECNFNPKHFVPLPDKFVKITYSKVLEEVECGAN